MAIAINVLWAEVGPDLMGQVEVTVAMHGDLIAAKLAAIHVRQLRSDNGCRCISGEHKSACRGTTNGHSCGGGHE